MPSESRACNRRRASAGGSNRRKSGPPGSIQAAANGESSGRTRNRIGGCSPSQHIAAGNIEDIFEHLAARLTEQRDGRGRPI